MANLTEREFLIKLAVDKYNDQYSTKIKYEDVTICSIDPNYNTDLGYEIVTTNQLDFVRLRVYLTFDAGTHLYDYRVENDTSTGHGVLTDEVSVTLGTLASFYRDTNIYKFSWLDQVSQWGGASILLTEDFEYITTEDGEPILI